jgi:hypothetical protein
MLEDPVETVMFRQLQGFDKIGTHLLIVKNNSVIIPEVLSGLHQHDNLLENEPKASSAASSLG